MIQQYETRIVSVMVVPVGQPTYSEAATEVRIVAEVGSEYVEVEQEGKEVGKVCITSQEWPALREAIDRMIAACREDKK